MNAVLYHGTREGAVPFILQKGLRPRRDQGAHSGNWGHSVKSNSQAVYLTDAYALHFGAAAMRPKDEAFAVLEIDLAQLRLSRMAPDEDYLEQSSRKSPEFAASGKTMEERTRWFRSRAHREFAYCWGDSLRALGTCAYYDPTPPQAIRRWARVELKSPIRRASDPTITLMNYKLVGGYYRQLMRHVFGDELDLTPQALETMADRAEYLRNLPRTGIQILPKAHSTTDSNQKRK